MKGCEFKHDLGNDLGIREFNLPEADKADSLISPVLTWRVGIDLQISPFERKSLRQWPIAASRAYMEDQPGAQRTDGC